MGSTGELTSGEGKDTQSIVLTPGGRWPSWRKLPDSGALDGLSEDSRKADGNVNIVGVNGLGYSNPCRKTCMASDVLTKLNRLHIGGLHILVIMTIPFDLQRPRGRKEQKEG